MFVLSLSLSSQHQHTLPFQPQLFLLLFSVREMAKMTPPPPPASQRTRYDLPGFTLPLNFTLNTRASNGMFPNALDYADISRGMVG